MDDLEAKEIEKEVKKIYIAQIKLNEIIGGASNRQPRPPYLVDLSLLRSDLNE